MKHPDLQFALLVVVLASSLLYCGNEPTSAARSNSRSLMGAMSPGATPVPPPITPVVEPLLTDVRPPTPCPDIPTPNTGETVQLPGIDAGLVGLTVVEKHWEAGSWNITMKASSSWTGIITLSELYYCDSTKRKWMLTAIYIHGDLSSADDLTHHSYGLEKHYTETSVRRRGWYNYDKVDVRDILHEIVSKKGSNVWTGGPDDDDKPSQSVEMFSVLSLSEADTGEWKSILSKWATSGLGRPFDFNDVETWKIAGTPTLSAPKSLTASYRAKKFLYGESGDLETHSLAHYNRSTYFKSDFSVTADILESEIERNDKIADAYFTSELFITTRRAEEGNLSQRYVQVAKYVAPGKEGKRSFVRRMYIRPNGILKSVIGIEEGAKSDLSLLAEFDTQPRLESASHNGNQVEFDSVTYRFTNLEQGWDFLQALRKVLYDAGPTAWLHHLEIPFTLSGPFDGLRATLPPLPSATADAFTPAPPVSP